MSRFESFKQTVLISPLFGLSTGVPGLLLSTTVPNAAPGGGAVLVALMFPLLAMLFRKLVDSLRS